MGLIFCQEFYTWDTYEQLQMTDTVDLPDRAIEVLELVVATGGSTTTTSLKEATHWATENQHIHYRLDQLEEAELVQTWIDDDSGRSPLGTRRASSTDAGDEFIDEIDDENKHDKSLEARVERLEEQFAPMRDTYGEVKRRIVELEKAVEEHDDDLDAIAEDVRYLREFVEDE